MTTTFKSIYLFILCIFSNCCLLIAQDTNSNNISNPSKSVITMASLLNIDLNETTSDFLHGIDILSKNKSINVGSFQIIIESYSSDKSARIGILNENKFKIAYGSIFELKNCQEARIKMLEALITPLPMEISVKKLKQIKGIGNLCFVENNSINNDKNSKIISVFFIRSETLIELVPLSETDNLLDIAKELDKLLIKLIKEKSMENNSENPINP